MIRAVVFDMYETLITHYDCPLYFSAEMAADAGADLDVFRTMWRESEPQRSTGKIRFEQIIETILRKQGLYDREIVEKIKARRMHTKEEGFAHLHEQILPMLDQLKRQGILIGLISNCFSEEAEVIEHSVLYPYFDAVCLSWREGVQKPDPEIYRRMLEKLGCEADECLYIGDGGSHELEAAQTCSMNPYQAVWYLQEGNPGQYARNPQFIQLEQPLEVVKLCMKHMKEGDTIMTKKIIAVNAGPRKGWNTDQLVKAAAEGAKKAGAEVEYVDLYKLERFTGCVSCFGCKLEKTYGQCVCRDGLYDLLQKIAQADGLIIGSPNYLGDLSAGFRALYERLVFRSLTYNKETPNCNTHLIPVRLIMTSNCSEELYDGIGYTAMLNRYKGTLERFVGPTEVFTCGNTLQVDDYSRFNWTNFDPEEKKAHHEETFASYLEKAEKLGKEMME